MSLSCASCERPIPDGQLICPFCDETSAAPRPASTKVDRAYRSAKTFVLLSFLFGWFLSPFAFWRAHDAVRLYHSSATDDPEMLRRLHRWRILAGVLVVAWVVVIVWR